MYSTVYLKPRNLKISNLRKETIAQCAGFALQDKHLIFYTRPCWLLKYEGEGRMCLKHEFTENGDGAIWES